MLKVYCDFNTATADERYWLLFYDDAPLEPQMAVLGLHDGDRVLLFQDPDDFEVEATLHLGCTDPWFIGEKLWQQVEGVIAITPESGRSGYRWVSGGSEGPRGGKRIE